MRVKSRFFLRKELPLNSFIMKERKVLLDWYRKNFRPLPWRLSRNPYHIWISEIMLQQTTVKAVIPYFEKFITSFPDVKSLADSKLDDIYEHWAGLGYYSRARNIHTAAKQIKKNGFPISWKKWIELPGIGPYTSRAITSFSYSERVGILDGNVIRFLSRYHGLNLRWWTTKDRTIFQSRADKWADSNTVSEVNQALIEIGATICLSKSPKCLICPLMQSCVALKTDKIDSLPLLKKRKKQEHWLWEVVVYKNKGKFGVLKNNYAPWLKGQLIWPGKVKKLKSAPKKFVYKHSVTHHYIYVKIKESKHKPIGAVMMSPRIMKKKIPQSLIQKTFNYV